MHAPLVQGVLVEKEETGNAEKGAEHTRRIRYGDIEAELIRSNG